jgi:hypothetical protein
MHFPPRQLTLLHSLHSGWLSDQSGHKHFAVPSISAHLPWLQLSHCKEGHGGVRQLHCSVPLLSITHSSSFSHSFKQMGPLQSGYTPEKVHTHLFTLKMLTQWARSPQSSGHPFKQFGTVPPNWQVHVFPNLQNWYFGHLHPLGLHEGGSREGSLHTHVGILLTSLHLAFPQNFEHNKVVRQGGFFVGSLLHMHSGEPPVSSWQISSSSQGFLHFTQVGGVPPLGQKHSLSLHLPLHSWGSQFFLHFPACSTSPSEKDYTC